MNKWKNKWQTKNGNVVWVKDMDDGHLICTINFLRRNMSESKEKNLMGLYGACPSGDGACDAVDREINFWERAVEDILLDGCTAYPRMCDEANKRDLNRYMIMEEELHV